MVIADLIALFTVLGLLGIGGKTLFNSIRQAETNSKLKRAEEAKMRDDLRIALASHDHRKLEDFMVLWGDKIPEDARKHIKQRIDELFIEKET